MKRKKLLKGLIYTVIILLITFNTAFAYTMTLEPKPPKPTTEFYSNDFANILSSSIEQDIVQLGEQTNARTEGGQIVFVSIKSLEGNTIEEYANTLYNNWKIGTKDKGVLLILSMDEGEARIEVGYGYEGILTDLQSNKLLQKLSSINKDEGLEKAVFTIYSDICKIVSGEEPDYNYKNDSNYNDDSSRNNYSSSKQQKFIQFVLENPIVFVLFIILIVLDLILTRGRITRFIFRMLASGARRGGGGGWGGGGGNSGGGGRSGGGGSSSRF